MSFNPIFYGYASVFNHPDATGDIILPGAFQKCLQAINSHNIKLLWQHNPLLPLGNIQKLYEDTKGLYLEAEFLLGIKYVDDAYNLIKNHVVNGLSIGFETEDSFYTKDNRYIKKAKLWEVSVVTFPANTAAKIAFMDVKSQTPT